MCFNLQFTTYIILIFKTNFMSKHLITIMLRDTGLDSKN